MRIRSVLPLPALAQGVPPKYSSLTASPEVNQTQLAPVLLHPTSRKIIVKCSKKETLTMDNGSRVELL